MRKFLTVAFAALAVFAAASCNKQDPDALTMTSSELRFTNEGGSQTVSFTSNVAWTAASDQSWLTLSATSGEAGNASITLTATENTDYSTRTANVTIAAGTAKTTYKVTQTEMAVFSPGVANVIDESAQQVALSITTNQDYTVSVDEASKSWIKVVSTKSAPAANQILLQISANDGFLKREGAVTVAASGNNFVYTIIQTSSFMDASLLGAAYISNVQKVYDNENYCPTTFGQYAVALTAENGDNVALVLNVSKEDVDKAALPQGEFTCDYEGAHTPGTFSTITLDGSEPYYTFIQTAEGDTVIVADGKITVSKEGDDYVVAAALYDENEILYPYSFAGAVAVEDRSIGLQVGSVSYIGDYYTYFANDNSQWDFNFYVTEPIAADIPHIYSFGLSIFDGQGIVDPQAIPTGEFTIADGEYIDSPYATGTFKIENGQAQGNGGYADYNYDEEQNSKNVTVKSGTVEISKADGYYTFSFDLVMTVSVGHYDDDWNWIVDSETDYDWAYTFEGVTMPAASDTQSRPQPDVDKEFSGNVYPSAAYVGYWYGDSYALGGNVFWFGWSTGVENWYTVTIPVHSSTPWVYEKNWNNRYCNTPVPDGTYTYVADKPSKNSNFIPNLATMSRRFLIKNGYTGSTVYVDNGNIRIDGDKIYVEAEGQITYTDGTASEDKIKFTGWLPNQCYYIRDWSKESYQKQVAWAE